MPREKVGGSQTRKMEGASGGGTVGERSGREKGVREVCVKKTRSSAYIVAR